MKSSIKYLTAPVMSLLTLTMSANAAVMTWQTPATITADSNVVTTGSLVGAYIPGANALATTVNGVAFTPVFVANAYDNTTTPSLAFGSVATLVGGPSLYGYGQYESGTPSGLSGNYTMLFSGGVGPCTVTLNTFTLTLNNLTIGQEYLFQTWANDTRFSVVGQRSETVTSGGSTSGTLVYNQGANGTLGSFVVGSFTADATTQAIIYGDSGYAQISAFQVRAIPEPSTFAMLAVGGLGAAFMTRRRRIG